MPRRTVNDRIAAGEFPTDSQQRREEVGIYGRAYGVQKPAGDADGFGWSALHLSESGSVSSGGVWKSKGASWAAKKAKPFASVIVIWDIDAMTRTLKRYWHRYTEEERSDINQAMAGYGVRNGSTDEARRSSPFAQWSSRAGQPAPVDAGASDGGSVHPDIPVDLLTTLMEASTTHP